MHSKNESDFPLQAARIITFLLLCAVAVTASYVESRYPTLPKYVASPSKP